MLQLFSAFTGEVRKEGSLETTISFAKLNCDQGSVIGSFLFLKVTLDLHSHLRTILDLQV